MDQKFYVTKVTMFNYQRVFTIRSMTGWWFQPIWKNTKVSCSPYSQYMGKIQAMFQTSNQIIIIFPLLLVYSLLTTITVTITILPYDHMVIYWSSLFTIDGARRCPVAGAQKQLRGSHQQRHHLRCFMGTQGGDFIWVTLWWTNITIENCIKWPFIASFPIKHGDFP